MTMSCFRRIALLINLERNSIATFRGETSGWRKLSAYPSMVGRDVERII